MLLLMQLGDQRFALLLAELDLVRYRSNATANAVHSHLGGLGWHVLLRSSRRHGDGSGRGGDDDETSTSEWLDDAESRRSIAQGRTVTTARPPTMATRAAYPVAAPASPPTYAAPVLSHATVDQRDAQMRFGRVR